MDLEQYEDRHLVSIYDVCVWELVFALHGKVL